MKIKGPNSKEYRAHLNKRISARRRQARLRKLINSIYTTGKAEAELCEAEAAGKSEEYSIRGGERRKQIRRREDLVDSTPNPLVD